MKALVSAFNQDKALVGAFSLIVQLCRIIINSSSGNITATIRECFDTDVLLGTIHAPLTPAPSCVPRDISGAGAGAGAGAGRACLCTTDLCNHSPAQTVTVVPGNVVDKKPEAEKTVNKQPAATGIKDADTGKNLDGAK